MAIKIQGGATANLAEVDANKNLKSNTYYATPAVNLGTFGVTTTLAPIGWRINVSGYKYIKIFGSGTMTANVKGITLNYSSSHTVSWILYPLKWQENSDICCKSSDLSGSVEWIYVWYVEPFRSKSSGTDYVNRFAVIINIMGSAEIQLYASHNDTGTINTSIHYVLFNN